MLNAQCTGKPADVSTESPLDLQAESAAVISLRMCRVKKLTKAEIANCPWLKSAPYCINLSNTDNPTNCGVLICEARTPAASSDISLNVALSSPFSMTSSSVQLPPWYQVRRCCYCQPG